jgi:antitoxin (DNA-binding transcriptional repressor) of toxin-antitoxin stability system
MSKVGDLAMSDQYSIEQISDHLEQIIQDVEQGTAVQLIRQGERVAVILSATEYDREAGALRHRLLHEKQGFGQAIERFRQEYNVEEADINPDEVFKDVRDNSPGREVIF